MAGEELLHGGLFEVALLGDEPIQPAQQRIHITQRFRDGALFGELRYGKLKIDGVAYVELLLSSAVLNVLNLSPTQPRIHGCA